MKNLIGIIIGVLILLAVTTSIISLYHKHILLVNDWKQLSQEENTVQQEKSHLTKIIKEGKTEEEREREARLMLGYKKRGEKVILVVPSTETGAITSSSTISQKTNSAIPLGKRLWYNIERLFKR